jgi:hypothetical protein
MKTIMERWRHEDIHNSGTLLRFHRSGQFWMTAGDEALVCLETFWRNARWSLLFPHVPSDFDPSKN